MKQFLVPAGSQVFLGAPASPMPVAKIAALRELVSSINGVIEAHLPQVFAHGMDRPAQILVLLITPAVASDAVFEALGDRLGALIGGDEHLDVWVLSERDGLLNEVRQAGCPLYDYKPTPTPTQTRRSRWRLW